MSANSKIEWTDATWNPTTGCTKVSPACANCYIERTPPFRMNGRQFVGGHIPLTLHHTRLDAPKRWKKRRVMSSRERGTARRKQAAEPVRSAPAMRAT